MPRSTDRPSPDQLSQAAQAHRLDEVQRLLDLGAPADRSGPDELPALCWAAQHGDLEMVDRLLEHGADPHWSWHGTTLVHFAAIGGSVPVTQRLVALGVPLDQANRQGLRPSHHAAQKGQAAWLRQARTLGTLDLNAGDGTGRSPLHWAVEADQDLAVRALIDAGVDLRQGDHGGRTAAELARERQRADLASLIVGSRIARERTQLLNSLQGPDDHGTPTPRPSGAARSRPRL